MKNGAIEGSYTLRWEQYLRKVKERFDSSLIDAREACKIQLIESDYDYYTVFRTWTAIKSQICDIMNAVEQVWEHKMRPNVVEYELPLDLQCQTIVEGLHRKLEEFDVKIQGELSQMYYRHTVQIIEGDFKCSQCHTPLKPKKGIFRSHYVSCPACQSVNTFHPNTKYVKTGWNVIDNIVAMDLLPNYKKMQAALDAIQQQRPPVDESYWAAYKKEYVDYWKRYFEARASYDADKHETLQQDINRKLEEYRQYENTYKKTY